MTPRTITVPARPYDFHLPLQAAALVLIDMQRDFLEPGGFGAALGNDVSNLRSSIAPLVRLLGGWRRAGLKVVHTREGHLPDLSDCPPAKRERGRGSLRIGDVGPMGRILIRGQPGHEIIPELAPTPGEVVVDKAGKGAFYNTGLDETLKALGVTHLLLTGVTTEVCVQTTMREANDRGYECLLVEDCTDSYFPEFKRSTLDMVRAQGGIVGWTAPSAVVLEGLSSAAAGAV